MALTYELAELVAVTYGLSVAVLWPIALTRETRVDNENSSTLKGLAGQIHGQLIEGDGTPVFAVSEPQLTPNTNPPEYRMYAVKNGQAFLISIRRA